MRYISKFLSLGVASFMACNAFAGNQPAQSNTSNSPQVATQSSSYKHLTPAMQEELIRFFRENSETIARTFEEGMQTAQIKRIEKIGQGLVKNKDKLLNTPLTLGNKTGKVRLIVFVDPNCFHCRGFFKETLPKIMQYNIPELGISLLSWPMIEGSEPIARIMHAVYQQGTDKFQALLGEMGISQQEQGPAKPINKDELLTRIASKGIDVEKVKKALDSDSVKTAVSDTKKISEEIDILGTPFVVLATDKDVRMINTLQPEMLKKIIEAAIQGKQPEGVIEEKQAAAPAA